MTKFKINASDLPTYTVIKDADDDFYMSRSNGDWDIVFPRDLNHADAKSVRAANANDRFKIFTIVSIPVGYSLPKPPRKVLIWKDIPGFTEWMISDNLTIKHKRWPGYTRPTKEGYFILREKGKEHHWRVTDLGNEQQRKEFFKS